MTPQTISVKECEAIIDKLQKRVDSPYNILKNVEELLDAVCDENSDFHKNNPVSLKRLIIDSSIYGIENSKVFLGDVIERIIQDAQRIGKICNLPLGERVVEKCGIISLWIACGIKKSLNEILKKAKKELLGNTEYLRPKTPQSNLFLFLKKLYGN